MFQQKDQSLSIWLREDVYEVRVYPIAISSAFLFAVHIYEIKYIFHCNMFNVYVTFCRLLLETIVHKIKF